MTRSLLPLIALALGALALPASAAELRVGPGAYPSVNAALGAAAPGDTVRVSAGTYHERLRLTKPVALVGEGLPTIDGDRQGDVIQVMAPGCRVQGLHVTRSGAELLSDNAAIKVLASGSTIEGNRFDESLYDVYVADCDHHRIANNRFQGLTTLPPNDRGDAIRLHNSRFDVVEGNLINETRDGIYFNGSPNNVIARNTIQRVRYGLHYMYSDDNTFTDNRFTETEAGSALMFSRRLTLRRNLFTGNRGFRAYGLMLKECEDSQVEDNVIAGNRTGLFMDEALNNQLTHNRLIANDLAMEIRGSSENNTFSANTIAGNNETVSMPNGVAENQWSGNYWSDYRGYDLDGDGKGDVPHTAGSVFAYLSENFPPARLFLLSPSVQAVEFAERTFPVLDAPSVTDEHPAMHPFADHAAPVPGGFSAPLLLLSGLALLAGLVPLLFAGKAFRS